MTPLYCDECKHYVAKISGDMDLCVHPAVVKSPDLVRGTKQPTYCLQQRESNAPENCGPDAKLFEERK